MTQPTLHAVQCVSPAGLHTMAYKQWGDPANPNVLVCVHGVTRIADDFDVLAAALAESYRVICPDVVGRGRSSWLRDPQHYQIPQYVADMVTLLARVLNNPATDQVDWLGTSMGGLIGMSLAALPHDGAGLIRKMIMNDIGPGLNPVALNRIAAYIGLPVRFPNLELAISYIRTISTPFGLHTDDEWRKIATDGLRQDRDEQWIRHYDLRIAKAFEEFSPEKSQQLEKLLWATYDRVRCPTLVIRGAESDLLTPETAQAMTQRGPHAELIDIPGVGHAPTFMHADQIAIVRDYFLR